MWLLADSGSTKTTWRLVDNMGQLKATVSSEGLNPYFLSVQDIASVIKEKVTPYVTQVEKVFFYGAGCSTAKKQEEVIKGITLAISSRHQPEVQPDTLAAARSLLQRQQGVCCILGTGANSCVYDGQQIIQTMPSLGYILSDWGSGTVISKDFIALLLQEKLPGHIREDFYNTYQINRPQMLDKIYNNPRAARFLASFTPFLAAYAEEPLVANIIHQNFCKFFEYYVLNYPATKGEYKISAVGSVAFHFQQQLRLAAEQLGIQVQNIVQFPMDGLVQYHCATAPKKPNSRAL